METYLINNQLYARKTDLKNWDFNLKTLHDENYQKLLQARKDFIDVTDFLVMPVKEAETEYFLVLGGNSRNLADDAYEVENEPVKIIDFVQLEDSRWYVAEYPSWPLIEGTDVPVRREKKSFATKEEAMQTYSLLHNSQYAGIDPTKLSNIMGSVGYEGIEWDEFVNTIGDPKSIQAFVDKVAGEPTDLGGADETETPGLPTSRGGDDSEGGDETEVETKPEKQEDQSSFIEVPAKCPDCGLQFFAKVLKKHLDKTTPEEV